MPIELTLIPSRSHDDPIIRSPQNLSERLQAVNTAIQQMEQTLDRLTNISLRSDIVTDAQTPLNQQWSNLLSQKIHLMLERMKLETMLQSRQHSALPPPTPLKAISCRA